LENRVEYAPKCFDQSPRLELQAVSESVGQSCRRRCWRLSAIVVPLGRTIAGDVGDSLVPLAESEAAVRLERALGVPAQATGSVRQNEDPELVVDEFEQVEVLTAVEPDGPLVVELVKDELEPEQRDVVVASATHWHQSVVGAQACCPGSTKGRPGSHSWIEFVRT